MLLCVHYQSITVTCLGWKWREFRQANHPSFWVCQDGCKSGCGAELCTYSHCNGVECNGSSNGTMTTNGATNGQGVETKFKYVHASSYIAVYSKLLL